MGGKLLGETASRISSSLLSDKEGSASRNFFLSALWWSLFAMGAGLFAAAEFAMPDLVHNVPQLSMPHLRMWHVNGVTIGWLSMGYVGAMYYMVPSLCKTKLWSERLGNFTMWVWNVLMVGAFCTLLNGNTEGREYAELGAVIDVMVVIGLLSVATNIYMTLLNRKVKKLYVSLWYFLGSLFWFPLVYIIGQRTFVALPGLNDAIVGWFYGHNILGMWFTTVGVGMMYYLLPRLTQAPLYSHGLSMLGFWGIALFYAPTGTHHILQSPAPEWLKAIAVISSIFLLCLFYSFDQFLYDYEREMGHGGYRFTFALCCHFFYFLFDDMHTRTISSYTLGELVFAFFAMGGWSCAFGVAWHILFYFNLCFLLLYSETNRQKLA